MACGNYEDRKIYGKVSFSNHVLRKLSELNCEAHKNDSDLFSCFFQRQDSKVTTKTWKFKSQQGFRYQLNEMNNGSSYECKKQIFGISLVKMIDRKFKDS